MIRRLRGKVIDRTATTVVVDVHGVGYLVTVPKRAELVTGEEIDLYIFTAVREDAIQLFGFMSALELEVFEHLISVPTVGPVKAIGILETAPEEIITQVRQKDLSRLSKLPGVGKKTAERIVVDLADKLGQLATPASSPSRPPMKAGGVREDLVSALTNLGFRPGLAEDAAARALERSGADADFELLLREALTTLTSR